VSFHRFDRLEVVLIAILAAVVGAAVERAFLRPQDADWLTDRYGKPRWSHGPEELIVRDFFEEKRGGIFLDVGSADARHGSNTYRLEAELGWSGLAVDALAEYAASYAQHRPRTRFFTFFVGNRSDATATMFIAPGNTEGASGSRAFSAPNGEDVELRTVPTITLDDLLHGAGIERIDFLSMDIELAEPQALEGFDIETYRPALVCIESHPPIRQQLMNYFSAHRYVLVTKYLWADRENFWFAPAGTSVP
jgi:FkbM family methyltransferase